MAQIPQDDPYSWLARIAPVATPLAIGWAMIRGYFALVSRRELKEILREMERQRSEVRKEAEALNAARHEESKAYFADIFARLRGVESQVAGLEGELRARGVIAK
jgi:hypothetical protein